MDPVVIIIIAVLVVFITLAIVFIIIRSRKVKIEKAESDELQPGFYKSERKGGGTIEGIEYKYEYTPGSQYQQPSFRITVECVTSGSFKLSKQTWFDRFFKKLGITQVISTGYADFDDRFYLTTDDVDFTESFFSKEEKRQAALEIYENGFNIISHNGKVMEAKCSPFKLKDKLDGTLMAEIVSGLGMMSRDIPEVAESRPIVISNWKSRRAAAFVIPSVIFLAGIVATGIGLTRFKPLDGGDLFLDSLKISLPLIFIFMWFAVRLIRGRSSSHWEISAVFVITLLAFIVGVFGFEAYLNGRLDTEEASVHTVKVVGKYISKSKDSETYSVKVVSWREGRTTEKLKISHSQFRKVVPFTSEATVKTKPGRFGFEWLVGYRLDVSP